jgi:cytochrome c oxidase subunit 4
MSDHTPISPEITFVPEHASDTKRIWRTFWLLSILTVIELIIGLSIYKIKIGNEEAMPSLVLAFKGMVCILALAKAYYIVSIFMHLGDEVRNLIMTIVVPLCLFVWFITAFLVDGTSWKNLRNRYSRPLDAPTEQVSPVKE